MFIKIYSLAGEDLGFLNLSSIGKFKLQLSQGSPAVYTIVVTKGSTSKTFQIPTDVYKMLIDRTSRGSL